jgi:hypothetical protein
MKTLILKLQALVEDFEKANKQLDAKDKIASDLAREYQARLSVISQREKDVNLREAAIQPIENLQAAIKENDKATARIAEQEEKLRLDIADFKRKSDEERQYLKNRELACQEVEKNNAKNVDEIRALKENYKTQVLAEIAKKVK